MIKYYLFFITIFFVGCQTNNHTNNNVKVFGEQNRSDKNFIAYISNQEKKQKVIDEKIKLKKMEIDAQIEKEKIRAKKDIEVAQITSKTSKEIAQENAKAKIEATKIEVSTIKERSKTYIYIALIFAAILIIAIIIYYLKSKKDRELQERLHKEQMALKEKELHEKRVHKMLDLVAAGKVPKEIEEKIIGTIAATQNKLITK